MQLIKQFRPSTVLFSQPRADGTRSVMPGIPWPVYIYYDPPVSQSVYHCPVTGNPLTFQFAGKLSHVPTRILVDTGCSGAHYISATFCKRIGLRYKTD